MVEFSSQVLRKSVYYDYKPQKRKTMTDARASVCLLLATALPQYDHQFDLRIEIKFPDVNFTMLLLRRVLDGYYSEILTERACEPQFSHDGLGQSFARVAAHVTEMV